MKVVATLFIMFYLCGCEELRRNGKPGDSDYIAPKYLQVRVIEYSPALVVGDYMRKDYTIVEDEEGKRYRIIGKIGPVGDTFKMDVSLMNEIGG